MAGNKLNIKAKGKDDKNRPNRGSSQTNEGNEESEDLDFALLRKPIPTSITGFAQARKIFDFATEELKDLLSNECDMMYECKVCRNIFRSLANFISHKRVFCKEKFNSSVHGHFVKTASTLNELIKIKQTELGYQESLKKRMEPSEEDESDGRIPMTKDLTSVLENIMKVRGVTEENSKPDVTLQTIPSSSVAVFQNMNFSKRKSDDNMRAQVKELDVILSRDRAVLQSDGKFKIETSKEPKPTVDSDTVIQISDDDENDDTRILKCKICDLQFSTQKTLKFHMKYKHVESRLVYPCPDCLEIFSTSWSVYRHLFKVHRKTAAQIRRLRESIQAKAFKMNNPPAFYEKRKNNTKLLPAQKITEEERIDQENQAWMDNMEGDGEVPRCGGCGRTFERRAALAAHTHTCQPRSRALSRRTDGKKIEIQIRKDYNKGPTNHDMVKIADNTETKIVNEDSQSSVISLEKDKNETTQEENDEDDPPMEIEDDDPKSNDSVESPDKIDIKLEIDLKPTIKLPFAIQAEKSNLAAFKQRILPDIEFNKLLCKKCDTIFNSPAELFEHMANHFKWMRYACKLCNFKHYNVENLPEHVKVVHKLKGDSDFYFSTVKAIDGTEAMIISRCLVEAENNEEGNEVNVTSEESRRPSRCSSDSSRLSDDSSSSSTLKESGSRKRKTQHNKGISKRKRESQANDNGTDEQKEGEMTMDTVMKVILGENNNSPNVKAVEENSSDLDDIEEKITKRHSIENTSSVASRRPVRKKTKPKNEDFEYDLSNLLKMEAQGYRDSKDNVSTNTTKSAPAKKKVPQEIINYENMNKDNFGALHTMSKKSVETATAHLKTSCFPIFSLHKERPNIFARPMLPRILSRSDKLSPKKDIDDVKDNSVAPKVPKGQEVSQNRDIKSKSLDGSKTLKDFAMPSVHDEVQLVDGNDTKSQDKETKTNSVNEEIDTSDGLLEKNKNRSIPAVPITLRRQSLDLIKNPLINKNIKEFSKAGMKTKILVIKPINRNKDGISAVNPSMKFQTIKLKDPSRCSSNEEKQSDQVMVVKVPTVDCSVPRSISDNASTNDVSATNNSLDGKNCMERLKNDTSENLDLSEKQIKSEEVINTYINKTNKSELDNDNSVVENENSENTVVSENKV